ncbi:putative bifunctional diguanylate cyclase/phosphodiesterase [Alteromonas sp. PRIM-21]|uniref:putative bifunctional diguanylate cyclase/phosphodiesterase n=1 Tax=Alteromonas sp. PRIM-21 TaxID=1454978 RepID=UPI0022B997D2|nr:EAL domain-containing protein [Alteromonas sp. PRIM-21]MCZ8530890.1 EAL domain-containing protein [Alteromonas sp. PRIM-21]
MDIHLLNALGITNCALFKCNSEDDITCLTPELPWLSNVVSLDENNKLQKKHVPSIFLDDFFFDADEVWKGETSFTLSSGFWTEQNENQLLRLEALAINSGSGSRYLVVKNVEEQFDEKQQTLQAARELLLSHHEIVGQHEYIRHRLNNVLRKNTRLQKLVPPIQQAIHNLETGVVILDNEGALILDNKASHRLLLCNSTTPSSIRIMELIKDIDAPSTFLPALVQRKAPWQGEIYWQPVDDYKVWLQVTIHPVLHGEELTHWVYLFTDITHIHNKEESVLTASGMDSLTKVANRNLFTGTVRRLVQEDTPFKLFIIDICDFKKINEALSYQSGDEILKSFALRLQAFVGNSGFIARIGSNEFALVKRIDTFKDVSSSEYVKQLVSKLTKTYTVLNGSEPNLGINIGEASFPQDCSSAETLLQCADVALQAAKYQGRNISLVYSEELHSQHNAIYELESELRRAIANNELKLFLQPIVDLSSGKIVKCEALTRWITPEGKFISPEVFIPLAEKSELIFPFGEWLINEACGAIEALKASNLDIRLAINISGRQVSDLALLNQIKNALEDHQLFGSNLSIELTESVFIESLETVSILLNELRAMGITVSIDDFGTGFSSLVYLKKLPIDELKIDRSFVSELEKNTDDQAIVQAILGLANNLNIKIIAEGIETPQQQQFLQNHQCAYGQGYLYQRPVAIDEFISLARKLK